MIQNKDRFPDVVFLSNSQIKIVGTVGTENLALIGFEQGTEAPIVARAQTSDPAEETLYPVPLYELLSHSYDPVAITESIKMP